MRIRSFVLATVVAFLPALASTASAQSPLRGVFRLGGEYGGEQVIEFTYSDGSSPDVTAGGGIVFTAGGALQAWSSGAHAVDAQLNVGVKYRTIPPATNQEATWLRFPAEALLYYRAPKFRIGAGGTMHLRNVLAASGESLDARVEFRSAPGFLLQGEYLHRNVSFDVRYTGLKYQIEGGSSEKIDASSIGVGVSYFVGRGG